MATKKLLALLVFGLSSAVWAADSEIPIVIVKSSQHAPRAVRPADSPSLDTGSERLDPIGGGQDEESLPTKKALTKTTTSGAGENAPQSSRAITPKALRTAKQTTSLSPQSEPQAQHKSAQAPHETPHPVTAEPAVATPLPRKKTLAISPLPAQVPVAQTNPAPPPTPSPATTHPQPTSPTWSHLLTQMIKWLGGGVLLLLFAGAVLMLLQKKRNSTNDDWESDFI